MSNEPNRDARRRRIVERVKEGETRQEIMQKEKISRVTLWSDLKALDSLFLTENSVEMKELKRRVGHALLESADNVLSGELAPDKANAWRGIMADFSHLFGLNAPSRSVTAHVDTNPEHSQEFLDYRAAVAHLNDEQKQDVLRYARSLPNLWVAPPMPGTTLELKGDNTDETA